MKTLALHIAVKDVFESVAESNIFESAKIVVKSFIG